MHPDRATFFTIAASRFSLIDRLRYNAMTRERYWVDNAMTMV